MFCYSIHGNIKDLIKNCLNSKNMKYELIRYPDGQISVKLTEFPAYFTFRIASYEDLFLLKSIVDVYKYNKKEIWSVMVPCFFGQRSDMRFSENQSFDLKN